VPSTVASFPWKLISLGGDAKAATEKRSSRMPARIIDLFSRILSSVMFIDEKQKLFRPDH
jgi:hypothetical protein